MKAAMNGVPSLSTLDGWWIEGCIEGATGWAIAESEDEAQEAESLYDKLENEILPSSITILTAGQRLCAWPWPSTAPSSTPTACSTST